MKKLIFALVALLTMTVSVNAMSYEQARDQALFLTDKMAYELNLTEDQYEAAYEINLDYLMSIDSYDDLYGIYWTRRNLDLSYILLDWQYSAYVAASYFYRPLYWEAGYWHFGIYARYPYRTYFYFGRPSFYLTYHGGHSWRVNGGRSWYHGRTYGAPHRNGSNHHGFGMRNGFDRGDYRNHSGHFERAQGGKALERRSGSANHGGGSGSFGGNRNDRRNDRVGGRDVVQRQDNNRSGDRRPDNVGTRNSSSHSSGTFGGNRSSNVERQNRGANVDRPNSSNVQRPNNNTNVQRPNTNVQRPSSSSNVERSSRSSSVKRGDFGTRQSSTRSSSVERSSSSRGSFSAPSRSFSSSSSSSRSVSAPSRSSSHSSGSFSSGSRGGGSHSGGASRGGGGSHGGGGSRGGFGGHR